jgi:glutamyl-tRNA(Gln) amidotransferase subunit E
VLITFDFWEGILVPELLSMKENRFVADLHLDPALARQVVYSEQLSTFERAVDSGIRPGLAARTLISTTRELSREGVDISAIRDDDILSILAEVEQGRLAKEAIGDVMRSVADGSTVTESVESIAPPISETELESLIRGILAEREDFIRERGMSALGPVMGVVMKEVRGRVDGKIISDIVKKEMKKML